MDLEQTVKDLQTQHAQFQETLLNLAKGQQEMMALLATKKEDQETGCYPQHEKKVQRSCPTGPNRRAFF